MGIKTGEVIEAGTSVFVAECYELHSPPPLGSLVRTTDAEVEIYGIICQACTESLDPGRRPVARGREETEEENIYRQNPQLSRLLRTTFECLIAGYRHDDRLHHYLPPRPPRVHSFVYICEPDDIQHFTRSLDFLPLLLNARTGLPDEVVSACLRVSGRLDRVPQRTRDAHLWATRSVFHPGWVEAAQLLSQWGGFPVSGPA